MQTRGLTTRSQTPAGSQPCESLAACGRHALWHGCPLARLCREGLELTQEETQLLERLLRDKLTSQTILAALRKVEATTAQAVTATGAQPGLSSVPHSAVHAASSAMLTWSMLQMSSSWHSAKQSWQLRSDKQNEAQGVLCVQ